MNEIGKGHKTRAIGQKTKKKMERNNETLYSGWDK